MHLITRDIITANFEAEPGLRWGDGVVECGIGFLVSRIVAVIGYGNSAVPVTVHKIVSTRLYRAPPSPPGAVFTNTGLAALSLRHSSAKLA